MQFSLYCPPQFYVVYLRSKPRAMERTGDSLSHTGHENVTQRAKLYL
jgi:hypothetical protein